MSDGMFIKIKGDSDGYMKFNCPFCDRDFKLSISEVKKFEGVDLYCPYCGLHKENKAFHSHETIDAAKKMAEQYAAHAIQKMFSDTFKNSKVIKYKPGKKIDKPNNRDIDTVDTIDSTHLCIKCNNRTKAINVSEREKIYCAYCGEII